MHGMCVPHCSLTLSSSIAKIQMPVLVQCGVGDKLISSQLCPRLRPRCCSKIESPEINDSSDGVSSTEISFPSDHFQSNTLALDLFSDHSFNDSDDDEVSYERNDSNKFLHQLSGVSLENLKASFLAIVSVRNASDALLNDLLKSDQLLFDGQSVSPWAVN